MVKKTRKRSAKGSPKEFEEEIDVPSGSGGMKGYFFFAIIGIVIIVFVILMITNAMKMGEKENSPREEVPKIAEEATKVTDMESLIKRVSELILVSLEEEPTVATVQDAEILRATNPSFYKDAKNGDRLLVWTDKAVLYSTEEDKLLAVMLISATSTEGVMPTEEDKNGEDMMEESPQMETPTSTIESEEIAIQVRNGTKVGGLAGKLSNKLKGEGFTVELVADARLKDYDKTVILKVSDKEMPATIKALVDLMGAEVLEETPDGETGVGGDVVIFIGADYEDYLK